MKQPISIVRGTTNFFRIDIVDQDGEPYKMGEDEKLVFGIKANPLDSERIFTKEISANGTTVAGGTFAILDLYPSDTLYIEPGKYVYDIGLQVGDNNFYNVVEASQFEIKPNITELGDGS